MITINLWILLIAISLLRNGSCYVDAEAKPKNTDKFKVHFLEANSTYNFKPTKLGFFEMHLHTYCYGGKPKTLGRFLETIELQLEIDTDDYTQYDGATPQEVEKHYREHNSLFSFSLFSQKRSRLSLSPFTQQCIGIETAQSYNVHMLQERMDYRRSIMLLTGIFIFLFAGHLSSNSILYYITGILVGICSSFLLLIWLSGKLMPRRAMMYGVLIGGWTVGLYVIRMLWDNLQMIMVTYRSYVCWYILITGMISFLLCYRWGPPKNRRSKNIIKWLLQLLSLTLIYFSSNFKEAAIAVIIMVTILHYFPRALRDIMRLRGRRSTGFSDQKDNREDVGIKRDIRKDCKQWIVNSPKHKEWKIRKSSSRQSINKLSTMVDARNSLQVAEKVQIDLENYKGEDHISDSDVSANENNASKQKLYLLPDGSFLLSDKRPQIYTPQQLCASPVYHRSTPVIASDENDGDEDHTPRHHSRLLASHSRRLASASSTSELFVKSRRNLQSPSHFQRASSVQRSARLMSSTKKAIYSSNPKIKLQKPETDESEG